MKVLGALSAFWIIILLVLAIILPISVYAAQKWAFKYYKELHMINKG